MITSISLEKVCKFLGKTCIILVHFCWVFVVILFGWFVLVLPIGLLCKGHFMNLFLTVLSHLVGHGNINKICLDGVICMEGFCPVIKIM